MKSAVIFSLVFAVVLVLVLAEDCDYEGHKLNIGATYKPPKECLNVTCVTSLELLIESCPQLSRCGSLKIELIPEDTSKPFPDCCPHYIATK